MSEGGRTSRRAFLERLAAGTAAVGAAGVAACVPPFGIKVSKATAEYRDAPNGGQRCADCTYFLPPDRCSIVEGAIGPNGWSRYYKRKTA